MGTTCLRPHRQCLVTHAWRFVEPHAHLHRSCTLTLGLGWPFLAIGKRGPEAIAVILSVLDAAQFRYFDLQAIFFCVPRGRMRFWPEHTMGHTTKRLIILIPCFLVLH